MIASKKELILVLPYLGKLSFEILKRIQCCLEKNALIFNLKVVFSIKNDFLLYLTFKDKNSKVFHSDIVYAFKACVRYFSLFLKEQCFLVISNEIF